MTAHLATTPADGAEAVPAAGPNAAPRPALSVVIKALNEAEKIEACLRSVLAATDAASTEIIVADSLSDDATVAVAARFPVKVVQLARREDRGCGSAAQLGFQYARGKRLLLLDGDMELDPAFLPAANAALDADPKLAGVAGLVIDRVMTLEFRRRNQNPDRTAKPGPLDHLNGGGLFRMEAIQPFGFFTDRNLHAFEELDLGLRLTAAGWRMRRLDRPSVYHYGHAIAAFPLLLRRWKTRYLHGHGELLRSKWGTDLWWRCFRGAKLSFAVILWWVLLLALLAGMIVSPIPEICAVAFAAALIVPTLLQCLRKRSLAMGVYSIALINFHAAGLLAGLLTPRVDPKQRIDSTVRHPES
jgi:glycosyltransferase involved in cell wall biosynthesis